MAWIKRHYPLIVIVIAMAVLCHRMLLGEVIFWGVPTTQFYPWREAAFSALRAGQLPLWSPEVGGGAPLLANYQTAVFYPPSWVNLILPTEYAMTLVPMLHIAWAGWGMVWLLRAQSVDQMGQAVGGLAFAFSGYLIARFSFISVTMTIAWLPWLLWAVDALLREMHPRRMIALALITAMLLLAGHAQSAFYALLFAGLFTLWRLRLAPNLKHALSLLASVLIGVVVAAIQLVPTAELLLNSSRSGGVTIDEALVFSFWPWRFFSFAMPNFFGTPALGTYAGLTRYWEDAIFVGVLPVGLAFLALVRWWRTRDKLPLADVPFLWGAVVISMLFALGRFTPIYPFLYRHVPTFDLFRGPTRWSLLAVFALSWLAGLGASQWRITRSTTRAHERLAVVGLAFIIASGVSIVTLASGSPRLMTFAISLLRLGGTLVAIGLLGLWAFARRQKGRDMLIWQVGVGLFVAVELVSAHWGLIPTIRADYYRQPPEMASIIQGERYVTLPQDEITIRFETYLDDDDYRNTYEHWLAFRSTLPANVGQTYRVAAFNNDEPLQVGALSERLSRIENAPTQAERLTLAAEMGVGVVRSPRSLPLEALGTAGGVTAYSLPDAQPRASIVTCSDVCAARQGTATIQVDDRHRVVVEVQTDQPAQLLLLDTYYPGWQATVDGDATPIREAQYGFRLVDVPAGSHTVEFSYRPLSIRIGAGLTVVGLLFIGGLWLRGNA